MSPEEFSHRVRAFASRPCSLPSTAYPGAQKLTIPVHPLAALSDLVASAPISAIFHTAFLTRERLASMGVERYVAVNRGITAQVCQALELAPAARIVVISSGAATVHESDPDPSGRLFEDPYGVLKLEEERIMAKNSHALVLRIYALSGRFIRDPAGFALGDFLLKAQQGLPIRIASPVPVLRSYGHAGDIAALAWAWLLSQDPPALSQLDAVTHQTSLESLAELVSTIYNLPPVVSQIDRAATPQSYVAISTPFLAALEALNRRPLTLEQQIIDTGIGMGIAPGTSSGRLSAPPHASA
jgi:nucleoside-diphosphate-sugar epimerase